MKTAYYEKKAQIMTLATSFYEGDEATRDCLRHKADFFPLSRSDETPYGLRSMIVRLNGEIFLVEDTSGGETGVFSLLLPAMQSN